MSHVFGRNKKGRLEISDFHVIFIARACLEVHVLACQVFV